MTSIMGAVAAVKTDSYHMLDATVIKQACDQTHYRWRDRLLNPVVTIRLFLLQILHGHTACQAVTHLSPLSFTAQAYCAARKRIPLRVYQCVCRTLVQNMLEHTKDAADKMCWYGHRILCVDGSGVSMPDEEQLAHRFGKPGGIRQGCGFPVAHLLVVLHASTGMIVDVIASCCRTHDMSRLMDLLKHLRPGDVLLADRGFSSYATLALVLQSKSHAVLRVHQRMCVSFKAGRPCRKQLPKHKRAGAPTSQYIRRLGHQDQWVSYIKPSSRPDWMDESTWQSLPQSITVRELRYTIGKAGYRTRCVTLVTTLLDDKIYTKSMLKDLYLQRWQIETNLRYLKRTLGMDVLRSCTYEGVLKEMMMFLIAYNIIRLIMLRSALQQGVVPDRISFIDTVRWLCSEASAEWVPDLLINPDRPGRYQPRVIKRAKDKYPRMTRPREQYHTKHLENIELAA